MLTSLFNGILRCKGTTNSVFLTATALRCISTSTTLFFHTSFPQFAEPMKKKKKMDPAILKAREEKKKKRIEKTIKKLEKNTKQLKPLEEIEIPLALIREKSARSQSEMSLKGDLVDSKALFKSWSNYKYKQSLLEVRMIDRMTTSQQRALEHVKLVSEDLYKKSVELDSSLIPLIASGPSKTPSIDKYEVPDGEIVDVSPKWD